MINAVFEGFGPTNNFLNAIFSSKTPINIISDPVSINDSARVNLQIQPVNTDLGIGVVAVDYQDGSLSKTASVQGTSTISAITTQPADPGSTVKIRILSINNFGVGNVSGATLQIKLPQGMTSGGGSPTQIFNGATNSWALPDLTGGAIVIVTSNNLALEYQATITGNAAGQTLTVQLSLTSGSKTDPNPANNIFKNHYFGESSAHPHNNWNTINETICWNIYLSLNLLSVVLEDCHYCQVLHRSRI